MAELKTSKAPKASKTALIQAWVNCCGRSFTAVKISAIAQKIASLSSVQGRRERVREGYKRVQFELRVTDLSAVSADELDEIINHAFR